jgi:hypothetical protein
VCETRIVPCSSTCPATSRAHGPGCCALSGGAAGTGAQPGADPVAVGPAGAGVVS